MDLHRGTMLKALLGRRGEGLAPLHFLSSKEKEIVDTCSTPEKIDFPALLSIESWMKEIHYSWFYSTLSALSPQSGALFLAFFDSKDAAKLGEMLSITSSSFQPSPLARAYLLHFLKEKMMPKDILPEPHLPPSPLNQLLELSKDELTHLIDLLGIYDLAAELRQVVDRNLLQEIHAALAPVQMQFLQYASKQPLKWMPPKLNLKDWDKEKKTLQALLHKRGLYRLGKALCREDKSLQWHAVHRLDTGRGEYLMKLFAGKEDPAMITYFKGQVLNLLNRR